MSEGLSREAHEKWAEFVMIQDNFFQILDLIASCPALRVAAWSALTSFDLSGEDELFHDNGEDELLGYMKMPEIRWTVWFYFLAHTPSVKRLEEVAKQVPELKVAAEAAIRVHPVTKADALNTFVGSM